MIAVGLLTGFAAFLASGMMAVAYFMAHAKGGFWPMLNKGEPAVIYCFLFLSSPLAAAERTASTACCSAGDRDPLRHGRYNVESIRPRSRRTPSRISVRLVPP